MGRWTERQEGDLVSDPSPGLLGDQSVSPVLFRADTISG